MSEDTQAPIEAAAAAEVATPPAVLEAESGTSQPVRLLALGDPNAALCEGDACYLPDPQSV
jgi:hypothetical protein